MEKQEEEKKKQEKPAPKEQRPATAQDGSETQEQAMARASRWTRG